LRENFLVIIGIVAIAQNYAIGKDGKLPWHYSADLKFFKEKTTGNVVVMGSNTWRSIGKPLPNRLNIVLSHTGDLDTPPGVLVLRKKDDVTLLAKYLNCDLFLIGGAKTFENFADVIDQWIVTEVPATVDDANVFMPEDFLDGFELLQSIEIERGLLVRRFLRKEN
jgi:dihydrofolate reductase